VAAIWAKVLETPDSNTWWLTPFKLLSIVVHDFNLSFERTDFLQNTWWSLWLLPRWRAIHTVGVVQQIRWEPVAGQPYTGIFEGNQYGIVRYSIGLEPWSGLKEAIPGFAVKFFRDGMHSGNMHTISGLSARKTTNFFERDFINHIEESRSAFIQVGAGLFSTGQSVFPMTVGTKNFASYTQAGQLEENIKFPFRVVYKPEVSTPARGDEENVPFTQDLVDTLSQTD